MTKSYIALLSVLLPLCATAGCTNVEPYDAASEIEDDEFRTCTPDWEIVADAEEPCHMDVDRHIFYRTVEAYGVNTYADLNGCTPGVKYDKFLMDKNRCTYGAPSTYECAIGLWDAIVGNPYMPDAVYDRDTCPQPQFDPGSGGGLDGGGGDGGDMIE